MDVIIGGGPAGYFGAICLKEQAPEREVVLLEKGSQVLRKVKVSGGGRCNVTSGLSEPRALTEGYPRGAKALLGAFHRFGAAETREWFIQRGVPLKTEADGRVFPVSDSSATIVDCLQNEARRLGVQIRAGCGVSGITACEEGFTVQLSGEGQLAAQRVLLATGGSGHHLAEELGHTIVPLIPSLFTFNISDPLLEGMAGVAHPRVRLRALGSGLPRKGLEQTGPVLITHWGLSGPAVLKLSAWGARELHGCGYQFRVLLDWAETETREELMEKLRSWAQSYPRKLVSNSCPVDLPRRLWTALVTRAKIPGERTWGETGGKMLARLVETLKATELVVEGKSTFKEEFVTCGGVKLAEIDFQTLQSKICPGLFLAGEMLDIDGITGGFNFQNCWTTGYLAGQGMAKFPSQ